MRIVNFIMDNWHCFFGSVVLAIFFTYMFLVNFLNEQKEDAKQTKHLDKRIVAAANRYSNGITLVGIRHWDTLMQTQAMIYTEQNMLPAHESPEQGFLDNKGNFHTREQAWEIAKQNKQIIRRVGGDDGVLYSENLY